MPMPKLESIMVFIEYENVMNVVKKTAEDYTNNFNPFLVVAKLDGLPYRFYLSVFDIIYQFESFTSAFDYLLKSFFVFDVAYPKVVEQFYIFIQQFIYNIYLKQDRKYQTVLDLIYELDQNRLPSMQK